MELLNFIQLNKNWKDLLAEKPYCLKFDETEDYILLNYKQIESDFYNPIVRECRGIILNKKTLIPVCIPFYKFGNYGEGYVPDIDWTSVSVQEKVDGSIMKLWWHNDTWHISTNGKIDAFSAELSSTVLNINSGYKNYGELFEAARKSAGLDYDKLNKNYTYMFELVSPYNKVVIPYDEVKIYHIGTRDNITFKELDINIGIDQPKRYPLTTLEECIKVTSTMPFTEEGYVVVDRNWNRIKIKSPQYVAVHHMRGNNNLTISALIKLVKNNEYSEFEIYFPEYTELINEIRNKINQVINELEQGKKELELANFETKKDFAIAVKHHPYSSYYFAWASHNVSPQEWISKLNDNKIKEIIGTI